MEPFRFVHAARLLLDHQLHGLGSLPGELRPLVEDATLTAFERVVDACIAHNVDCLLLAGDSFDHRDHSLRASAALARGLERLAAQDICVVIAAGLADPWSSWPEGLVLPPNVVRLGFDGESEVPISRGGRLLAVVRTLAPPDPLASIDAEHALPLTLGGPGPFTIVLQHAGRETGVPIEFLGSHAAAGPAGDYADANYWAFGGAPQSRSMAREQRVLHDPGPTQAVRPLESGPRGCTFVEAPASGDLRCTFIPTAAVRYESFALKVAPETRRDELLAAMREALAGAARYAGERLWLPAWNFSGAGPMLSLLAEPTAREEFLAEIHAYQPAEGLAVHTQAVRIHFTADAEVPPDEQDDLTNEFERALLDRVTEPAWSLQQCLEQSALAEGPWQGQLAALLDELDIAEVVQDARRLGLEWFAAEEVRSP